MLLVVRVVGSYQHQQRLRALLVWHAMRDIREAVVMVNAEKKMPTFGVVTV
jgi:hypothetical protein